MIGGLEEDPLWYIYLLRWLVVDAADLRLDA